MIVLFFSMASAQFYKIDVFSFIANFGPRMDVFLRVYNECKIEEHRRKAAEATDADAAPRNQEHIVHGQTNRPMSFSSMIRTPSMLLSASGSGIPPAPVRPPRPPCWLSSAILRSSSVCCGRTRHHTQKKNHKHKHKHKHRNKRALMPVPTRV